MQKIVPIAAQVQNGLSIAMDASPRPRVALANSSPRALTPLVQPVRQQAVSTSYASSSKVITLRQLAQPKSGGIK